MVLGTTQPLTEMSTRNLPGGKAGLPARKADNLTAICEPMSRKYGNLDFSQHYTGYLGRTVTEIAKNLEQGLR
jgi:hypothetical protein